MTTYDETGEKKLPIKEVPKNHEEENLQEWREVPRKHEVVAIGDLHGSMHAFLGNGEFAELFTVEKGIPTWKGGDRKAIFLGDILGDRSLDGVIILEDIHALREQARAEGGDITLLAGNHDNWAFGYLFNEPTVEGADQRTLAKAAMFKNNGIGLLSFAFIAGALGGRADIPRPQEFFALEKEIQTVEGARMLNDGHIRQIIRESIAASSHAQEVYGSYNIFHIVDDTLFMHCDPTKEMLEDLFARTERTKSLRSAVAEINETYQNNLKRCLKDPATNPDNEYRTLVNRYLATGNRESMTNPKTMHALREKGINAIVHGHSSHSLTTHPDSHAYEYPEEFLLLSADRGAYRKKNNPDYERSVARIEKNGVITCGIQEIIYRD